VTGQHAAGTGSLPGAGQRAGVIAPPRPVTAPSPVSRPVAPSPVRRIAGSPAGRQAVLLICYLAAGVALTWPRATYLAGRLPALRDAGGYVWDFWWVARQVSNLGNPWFTDHLAAPVGSWLGFHTLMPLPAVLLTPLTLTAGPSVSYNLLSIVCPGLLCYVMYRAARLWLPSATGAVAAGAFFGLSTILAWRSWYEINLAAGALFFPLALEASVRLRRRPGGRQAVILGLVLAGALLTDQESAVMTGFLTALVLLPWLRPRLAWPGIPAPPWLAAAWPPNWRRLSTRAAGTGGSRAWLARLVLAGTGAGTAVLVAAPQFAAMAQQGGGERAASSAQIVAADYVGSGAGLAQLFAPSPRLASYGLPALAHPYHHGGPVNLVVVGYGTVLSVLALLGLVVAWRRRSARLLALMWAACSLLALGTAPWIAGRRLVAFPEVWHGVRVSAIMPFTWFVQLPGLANFREADRFTELGLVGAALLAGAGVGWLAAHARPVLVVAVVLGLLEAGWPGNPAGPTRIGVMPAALPALDAPIAADRSGSVVVDVPFGIRGGLPVLGGAFPPSAMLLATADGHPRGDAFISRIPMRIRARIRGIPFYAALLKAQGRPAGRAPIDLQAAARSARLLHIGWVVDWERHDPIVAGYLQETGFRLSYQADGAAVYRPAAGAAAGWRRLPRRYLLGPVFRQHALLPAAEPPARPGPAGPREPAPARSP
jgi:hypothetical protein